MRWWRVCEGAESVVVRAYSWMDDLDSLDILAWSGNTRFMMREMLAMGSRRSWSRMASLSPPEADWEPPSAMGRQGREGDEQGRG